MNKNNHKSSQISQRFSGENLAIILGWVVQYDIFRNGLRLIFPHSYRAQLIPKPGNSVALTFTG
jgi:hypothetical protein